MPVAPLRKILSFALVIVASLTLPAAAALALPTGPDIASWQHPNGTSINWTAVRDSGQSFTFIKATEGGDYVNPYFTGDWKASAGVGLYHSAYHYARPSARPGSAEAQARFFASVIGDQLVPGTLPPVLDFEESGGLAPAALSTWGQTFLSTLFSLTGRTPVIYTFPNFWKGAMANSRAFTSYPLWIANYGNISAPTTLTWSTWTFWQYSATASLPGIATKGSLDVNRFNGTEQDLAELALAGEGTSVGQPQPSEPQPSEPTGVTAPDTPSAGASPAPAPAPSAAPSPTAAPVPTPSPVAKPVSGPAAVTDPAGYASAPSRYLPVSPTRIADSRTGSGVPQGPVSGPVDVTVPGNVPADAAGVVLNVSAVNPSGSGYLRVAAKGQAAVATVLNFSGGQSTTILADTRIDSGRRATLTVYGSATDLVVDLVGYYTTAAGVGGHWMPVTPSRFVDTRSGTGAAAGPRQGAVTVTLPAAVPAGASGAVLNVSVVDPSGSGYLRASAEGVAAQTTAINYAAHQSTTALVLTQGSQNRAVTISLNGGSGHLVVDLVGYYEGASTSGRSFVALSPRRFLDSRTALGSDGPHLGPVTVRLPDSVPADATSVLLNLSVVKPSGKGWLRLSAGGAPAETTAVNFSAGQSQTGLALTGVGPDRTVTVWVYGAASDLVADLVGYHTGS